MSHHILTFTGGTETLIVALHSGARHDGLGGLSEGTDHAAEHINNVHDPASDPEREYELLAPYPDPQPAFLDKSSNTDNAILKTTPLENGGGANPLMKVGVIYLPRTFRTRVP